MKLNCCIVGYKVFMRISWFTVCVVKIEMYRKSTWNVLTSLHNCFAVRRDKQDLYLDGQCFLFVATSVTVWWSWLVSSPLIYSFFSTSTGSNSVIIKYALYLICCSEVNFSTYDQLKCLNEGTTWVHQSLIILLCTKKYIWG